MTDSLLPDGKLLHQMSLPIRWGDMDALNHVNNTVYFRYFEQTRIGWYETTGLPELSLGGQGFVIVDNHAEYLRPLIYPATITVRMGGHSPGRSSFISTYSVAVDEQLYTRGSARIVWIDQASGRSVALPDAVRSLVDG